MEILKCVKESFVVIGKEGSSADGEGFIARLWNEVNSQFEQVSPYAKRDENGSLLGVWGVMSDFSRSFKPWENNFSEGLYLAGVECRDDSPAPDGWSKWGIPSYEYLYVENNGENTFADVIDYMRQNNIPLAGAVHDFTCPTSGKYYMFFPIRRL